NKGLLPPDYYALPEQQAAGFGPDVLTLQGQPDQRGDESLETGRSLTLLSRPRTRFMAESDAEFYRRKKSSVVVRHVSGDRIVSMVEIVSPGNKSSRHAFRAFVDKACELLEARVHLLIVDPFPPGPRDPHGVHAAIWEEVRDEPFHLPDDKQLTLVAYECGLTTRAYIEPVAVGDSLPEMPLFLEPDGYVKVPLDTTYQTAFNVLPSRWRNVLEPPDSRR
ncbi:MAG TPA: DUF4058 family protein, partial [Isosphaeraceae bacterium]|nr:DUF4058 family protein [Isosphaeraceae bacterium]